MAALAEGGVDGGDMMMLKRGSACSLEVATKTTKCTRVPR